MCVYILYEFRDCRNIFLCEKLIHAVFQFEHIDSLELLKFKVFFGKRRNRLRRFQNKYADQTEIINTVYTLKC